MNSEYVVSEEIYFMLFKKKTISAVSELALKTKLPVKAELSKAKLIYSLHPGFWALSVHKAVVGKKGHFPRA